MSESNTELPTGETGQLIDLLIQLLDQVVDGFPHWWFNYGILAGGLVDYHQFGDSPEAVHPDAAFDGLRKRLTTLVGKAGIDERFLVQSIVRDLTSWTTARADTGRHDERARGWRARLQKLIDDPDARARMRAGDPELEAMTDEQLVDELRRQQDGPLATASTVEVATDGWMLLEAWQREVADLLPDAAFESWALGRLARMPRGNE